MSRLSGQRVWLTGASSGIGGALASELARRGARLAITARRSQALEEFAARHPGTQVHPGDVTDREAMHRIADALQRAWGGIDLALLAAGTYVPVTPETFSADLVRRNVEVNVMGTVNCVDAVLHEMRRRRRGRVAVVASVAGYAGLPQGAGYGASKAFLISMCDSLRADLAPDGIGITVIAPGALRAGHRPGRDLRAPFQVDAATAARIVADGLEKGQDEIAFPLPTVAGMKLLRIMPGAIARPLVAGIARRHESRRRRSWSR